MPLSPNRFNLYINDLFSVINKVNPDPLSPGKNNYPISALMYADDLILMSTSHKGLQICLNELQKYYEQWKLWVNISKTKCMKFYKINKNYDHHFYLDGKEIDNVTEFTYLGVTINATCSFKICIQNLDVKATRALFAINSRYSLHKLPINIALKLFDSLIVPILLYGCEVWGPYEDFDLLKWDKTDIEKVHTQFLKQLLGVNVSTTNIMITAEIGK